MHSSSITRRLALLACAALLAVLAGCGGDEGGGSSGVEVAEQASFPAGTTMARLNQAGRVTVGVKYDQPGIGFKNPATGELEGFDIEIAKMLAGAMGIKPDDIVWKETVSKNREPFIQNGTVDMVLASYSITDERRKEVSFAGPYYVTGQQLLVAKDDASIKGPRDLAGKKVCSVTGSTSIKTVQEDYGAQPIPFATYRECVSQLLNGSVDAVTTDGAILLGYAAQQPDKLKVVGPEFSEERYGIGIKKGDAAFQRFLNDQLRAMFADGRWRKAFADTLGKSGAQAPAPPKLDPVGSSGT
jgi:glutamate transport system substrate-binding protein